MVEEKVEDLKEKAEETIKARDDEQKDVKIETPLEEVKRVSEETKKMMGEVKETLSKLEEINANIALGGKTDAGQPVRKKTQDDVDQEEANKMLGAFE